MIEGASAAEAKFVLVPVYGHDWLLGQFLLVKKFEAASDSDWQIVLIFDGARSRIMVLVKVESTITTKCSEEISILREMPDSPNC